jgi:hypothetical protein
MDDLSLQVIHFNLFLRPFYAANLTNNKLLEERNTII